MKYRYIKDISNQDFDKLGIELKCIPKVLSSSNIQDNENGDWSVVGKTKISGTQYNFSWQICGDDLCDAWSKYNHLCSRLAITDDCDQVFEIKRVDFCGDMYWDKVSILQPLTLIQEDEYCGILSFEFQLVSDHKWRYWAKNECCFNNSVYCGATLCMSMIDQCGDCKSIMNLSNPAVIIYNGKIDTVVHISATWYSKNYQIINLSNNSRIFVDWEYDNLTLEIQNWYGVVKTSNVDISHKIKKWNGIKLSPWENTLAILSDSWNPLSCLSRYDQYM